VDTLFVTGREYDQWKEVSRETALSLVKKYPQEWAIEGANMSVETAVSQINAETMQHAPTVLAVAAALEKNLGSTVPGATKGQIVADSILGVSQAVATSPNVTVASIGALTALFVSILNATGIFKHAAKQ
jgi:hypothetical protein